MTTFAISIILAESPGQPDLQPALASIERACAGFDTEMLVVRPGHRPALPRSPTVTIREIETSENTLIPERWGAGVRAATAPAFGCLTTEFTIHEDWARTLLARLDTGAVGAAGAIELASEAGMSAAAIYLVRFSAYLPNNLDQITRSADIPGDSAAYRRDAVVAFPDLLTEGFWEVEFHRRFGDQGDKLAYHSRALATFHPARGFFAAVVLRFRHGREHGINRVVKHRHNALQLVLLAPAVPLVLTARVVRRALATPGHRVLVARALAGVLGINAAWAVGEAVGAWSARGRR